VQGRDGRHDGSCRLEQFDIAVAVGRGRWAGRGRPRSTLDELPPIDGERFWGRHDKVDELKRRAAVNPLPAFECRNLYTCKRPVLY
jgi:hypothetical protein